jgi:hypothetical protein
MFLQENRPTQEIQKWIMRSVINILYAEAVRLGQRGKCLDKKWWSSTHVSNCKGPFYIPPRGFAECKCLPNVACTATLRSARAVQLLVCALSKQHLIDNRHRIRRYDI